MALVVAVRSSAVRRSLASACTACGTSLRASRSTVARYHGFAAALGTQASQLARRHDKKRGRPFSIDNGMMGMTRGLFVQTEETPNPNSLKFHPGCTVLPEEHGSGLFCTRDNNESKRSPLARRIFLDMENVTGVFLGRDFITLTKDDEVTWKFLRPMALSVIMDFFAENKPAVTDAPVASDTAAHEDDDEVVSMIKELLEERIRPSVQDDGGDIFYKGFDRELGLVKLQLAGACKGCPSSSSTLKNGVETMLMHYIPEVQGILEVVDDELNSLNNKAVSELESRLAKAGIPFSD
jgi:NFU1 iron-sulfur cluster scaffold homolog, mitochondrial